MLCHRVQINTNQYQSDSSIHQEWAELDTLTAEWNVSRHMSRVRVAGSLLLVTHCWTETLGFSFRLIFVGGSLKPRAGWKKPGLLGNVPQSNMKSGRSQWTGSHSSSEAVLLQHSCVYFMAGSEREWPLVQRRPAECRRWCGSGGRPQLLWLAAFHRHHQNVKQCKTICADAHYCATTRPFARSSQIYEEPIRDRSRINGS